MTERTVRDPMHGQTVTFVTTSDAARLASDATAVGHAPVARPIVSNALRAAMYATCRS